MTFDSEGLQRTPNLATVVLVFCVNVPHANQKVIGYLFSFFQNPLCCANLAGVLPEDEICLTCFFVLFTSDSSSAGGTNPPFLHLHAGHLAVLAGWHCLDRSADVSCLRLLAAEGALLFARRPGNVFSAWIRCLGGNKRRDQPQLLQV